MILVIIFALLCAFVFIVGAGRLAKLATRSLLLPLVAICALIAVGHWIGTAACIFLALAGIGACYYMAYLQRQGQP